MEWCAPPVEADPPDRDAMREATGTDIIPAVILEDGTVLAGETDEILAALDERFGRAPDGRAHKSPPRCTESPGQAGEGTRTPDLPLTRRLLYQLSYSGGAMESR